MSRTELRHLVEAAPAFVGGSSRHFQAHAKGPACTNAGPLVFGCAGMSSNAHMESQPAAMAVTPLRPDTASGVVESALMPSPQHSTVPPESRALVCVPPATRAVTSLKPSTTTGVVEHG